MLCATLRQWSAQHSLEAYDGHEAGQEVCMTSEVKHVLTSSRMSLELISESS